jgi:GntR family transcriptional regulator, transcriptional repressor for pyruvate dehydrogenase complex
MAEEARQEPAALRFESRKRRTASDDIAQEIRRYIQGLEPGDRIGTEQDLAREFGVSRPTIREALRHLSSAHLIHSSQGPGGGIFVARTANEGIGRSLSESIDSMLSTEAVSLRELLTTRTFLEVPLAGLAAENRDDAAIETMAEAIEEAAAHFGDHDTFVKWDARFHRTLAAAAGNELLFAFVGWAFDVLQPRMVAATRHVVSEEQILDQHRAILRAVERGNRAAAEKAMSAHLQYLCEVLSSMDADG